MLSEQGEPITGLNPRIPITTRSPRPGETNGVQYHFLSREEFEKLQSAGALREHGEHDGNLYGMLRPKASSYVHRVNSMRSRNVPAKNHLQTVLVEKENGSLNIAVDGGLQSRTLIYITDIKDSCHQVIYTSRPMRKGDCLIAIDGVSVAGVGLSETQQLLQESDDVVELLVYCIQDDQSIISLVNFLEVNPEDDADLKAVKDDVRKDIYQSIVPYTTRPPRDNEVDGETYHFIPEETFTMLIDQNRFIEYGKSPEGYYYGTPHLKPRKFRNGNITKSAFNRSSTYVRGVRRTKSKDQAIVLENAGNFDNLGMELIHTEHGNFILDVEQGSIAAKAGLHRGHQIVTVDGADLEHAERSVVRGALDRPTKKVVVGVRHNAAFSSAIREQKAAAKRPDVHTVVIARNDNGQWGLGIEGGADFGDLITFAKVDGINYLTQEYTIELGDCLLAVEDTSVAGATVQDAIELVKGADDTLELTVLATHAAGLTPSLSEFFSDSKYDGPALQALKSDVRKRMYNTTIPYTTRPKRDGEEDGASYHFVSRDEFLDMQADGWFVEWGEHGGHYYGTPFPEEAEEDEGDAKSATSKTPANANAAKRAPSLARMASKRQASRVQTAVLEKNADGGWGVTFGGGVPSGELPHLASIDSNARFVQFSDSKPRVNDVVLAINGISVGGHDSAYAAEILDHQQGAAELTFMPNVSTKKVTFDTVLAADSANNKLDDQLKEVIADVRKDMYQSNVPYTTRAPRAGEVRGREYNFVTVEEFKQMHDEGKFVEIGEVNGVYYGTAINQGRVSANHKPRQSISRRQHASMRSRNNRPRIFTVVNTGKELGVDLASAATSDDVVIANVKEGSAAHDAGLRENMRIVKVGSVSMAGLNVDSVHAALNNAYGSGEPTQVVTSYLPSAYVKSVRVPTYFSPAGKFVGGVRRIHLWGTPRSLTTCMLRAFGERDDTNVLDEPFYATLIKKNPGFKHPHADTIMEHQSSDPVEVLYKIGTTDSKPVLFCKHICSEYPFDVTDDWLDDAFHVVLYTDPTTVVSRYEQCNGCILSEAAFPQTLSVLTKLKERKLPHIVVSANDFRQHPEAVLRSVCDGAGIAFSPSMMSWEAGAHDYDGVWGETWYKSINKSTGFMPPSSKSSKPVPPLSASAREVISDSYPFFIALEHHKHSFANDHSEGAANVTSDENADTLLWVGQSLVPRSFARVSVFDASVQGGDAVWEGLRVYNGKVFNLESHLESLLDSAKAMDFTHIPSHEDIKAAVLSVLSANNMRDGVYVRILLTRGENSVASHNPLFNKDGCTLIVTAEHRESDPKATFSLVTGSNREVPTQCVDTNIHHTNHVSKILPQLQANASGANEALLLDVNGFVSQTTESNVFAVKKGTIITPEEDLCYAGTVRALVIALAKEAGMPVEEKKIPVSALYSADELFVASALGEITPVVVLDGRQIGDGVVGPASQLFADKFAEHVQTHSTPIGLPETSDE